MGIKINCKCFDNYGFCNKKPRVFFKLFPPRCSELEDGTLCLIAERYPKPVRPSPPPPPKPVRP